ncbi:MAG: nicotinamide-nucleotide amidohydrolase family protein [Deltaproteobacteria bacterium]|nr:nicotinamide-nucleotide amidohydrolase family protein [Deltaproteobacteria bacterium]
MNYRRKARNAGRLLISHGIRLATAESCTGGLLSSWITAIPGSSVYFIGGVIAYEDLVKTRLLGVSGATLKAYGAVSSQTAAQMADGVRRALGAQMGVSITGIAGPGGARPGKPVGTVFIGLSFKGKARVQKFFFAGTRARIRGQSAIAALDMIEAALAG